MALYKLTNFNFTFIEVSYYGANWRPHSGNTVLSFRVLSHSNRSLIILKTGSAGTEVNKAVTLYELRHSPGCIVTLLAGSTKPCVLWIW